MGLQQIRTAAGGTLDSPGFQCTLEETRRGARRTEQNNNVVRGSRLQFAVLSDQRSLLQHRVNSICDKCGFLRVGFLFHADGIQFYTGIGKVGMRNAFAQLFGFSVIESADFGTHTGTEYIIDRFDHFSAGTEIMAEQNLSVIPCRCLLRGKITLILAEENTGISQSELINGLLDITDHKAVLPLCAQGTENGILNTVRVLVFIHKDLPESASDLGGSRCGTAAGFSQEQIQRLMLQITEVQTSAASFGICIGFVKLPDQRKQTPCTGCALRKIRNDLDRFIGEIAEFLFQSLFAGITHRFNLLRKFRIRVLSGEGQPTIVYRSVSDDLIPGF